ncbi:hypothetical protein [Treponema pectinovorum]|uniref:hypothetical protein n=1 Tax=Treponema pectinovorum TaxID=164 RepID=UPI0011C90B58|nr:hypothetical protein [Treponema pectinovorum]
MFANGFQYYEDTTDYLEEGDYYARIKSVLDHKTLPNAVNVFFEIMDHPNATPCAMTLFARPALGEIKKDGTPITQDDLKRWDASMSRFFDAFKITPGDFNFIHWVKKVGYVTVRKNKNNPQYSSLFVAFKQHKENSTPQAQQHPAPAPQAPQQQMQQPAQRQQQMQPSTAYQQLQQAVGQTTNANGYLEDIPF